jgi:hypothetical protein
VSLERWVPPPLRIAAALAVFFLCLIALFGCEDVRDTRSLLFPRFQRSEIVGMVAGLGTTPWCMK